MSTHVHTAEHGTATTPQPAVVTPQECIPVVRTTGSTYPRGAWSSGGIKVPGCVTILAYIIGLIIITAVLLVVCGSGFLALGAVVNEVTKPPPPPTNTPTNTPTRTPTVTPTSTPTWTPTPNYTPTSTPTKTPNPGPCDSSTQYGFWSTVQKIDIKAINGPVVVYLWLDPNHKYATVVPKGHHYIFEGEGEAWQYYTPCNTDNICQLIRQTDAVVICDVDEFVKLTKDLFHGKDPPL